MSAERPEFASDSDKLDYLIQLVENVVEQQNAVTATVAEVQKQVAPLVTTLQTRGLPGIMQLMTGGIR